MKKWLLPTLVAVCTLTFASVANAIHIDVTNNGDGTDDNFNDITGGGNQNVTILEWLKGEILSYNNHVQPTPLLPDPTETLTKLENLNGVGPTVNVAAGDYLVLHYGVGTDGVPSSGGGLVALYFPNDEVYQVPNLGSGPNGFGGISFVDVWDHGVPDGGLTLALLGLGLIGISGLRRKLSK